MEYSYFQCEEKKDQKEKKVWNWQFFISHVKAATKEQRKVLPFLLHKESKSWSGGGLKGTILHPSTF